MRVQVSQPVGGMCWDQTHRKHELGMVETGFTTDLEPMDKPHCATFGHRQQLRDQAGAGQAKLNADATILKTCLISQMIVSSFSELPPAPDSPGPIRKGHVMRIFFPPIVAVAF